jgi:hypothetical protein
MSTPVWSKVGVDIQSAIAASLTVSAISKASPAVLSYGAGDTDPANGEYYLVEATGMDQINNMVVRVANVDTTANTFECESLDSTNFDTFVSATAKKITFGKSFDSLIDITASGGDAKFSDNSDLHSDLDKEIPVGFTAVKFTSNSRFEPTDSALLEAQSASRAKDTRCILMRFSNGTKIAVNAYVSAPLTPTGNKGEKVTTPLAFSAQGFPSVWAS